ncbi:MAG: polysaccharide deacetylase family protein [Ignavibacteria bacterium]|nr:polysaccharide deacetylase family protein [Ignavibacteria bacterium]
MKKIITLLIIFIANFSFAQKKVAITFDDLPSQQMKFDDCVYITDNLLKILKDNNLPIIGFVNAGKTDVEYQQEKRIAQLKKWIAAGYDLGNHTYAHSDIGKVGLQAYEEDVIKGEPLVIKLMEEAGKKMKYYRHPFLYTGKSVEQKDSLDKFLKERGYTIAPVTLDNSDWMFNSCYYSAKAKDNKTLADSIVASYLEYMNLTFDFFENLSQEFLGRQINHVLLVHSNMINADHFDKIINMLKSRGYEFISLDEALTDTAYSLPDAQMKWGRSWIHRWMKAKGLTLKSDPNEPKWIVDLYTEIAKSGKKNEDY